MDLSQKHVTVLKCGDRFGAVGHFLLNYCSSQGLIWPGHITGREKTALPDHKKKDSSAKLFVQGQVHTGSV